MLETGGLTKASRSRRSSRVVTRAARRRDELRALAVAEAKIDGFFEEMPRRYFVSHRAAPDRAPRAPSWLHRGEGRRHGGAQMRGDFSR
jgi:hypothetical protein